MSFRFDIEGEVLEALARYRCNVDLKTVDLDRDSKDKPARAATVRGR
ncbi:MAG: hypothetical protein R3B70_10380 [Polyangiaceae bacterium]